MPVHKSLKQNKVLLDTHVWIWLMLGDDRLNLSFRKAMEGHQKKELIFISAISVWEIGMLAEKKRIDLEIDCLDWVNQALASPGINLLPLSPSIAIESSRLPHSPHGDPIDRILMATAQERHAILVTHDPKILEAGKNKWLRVYDPCD